MTPYAATHTAQNPAANEIPSGKNKNKNVIVTLMSAVQSVHLKTIPTNWSANDV